MHCKAQIQKMCMLVASKSRISIWEDKGVVACAATGAGKTLTFWIPLLMAQVDGMDSV